MSDPYERDKDGNIVAKAITEDPGTGPVPAPATQGRASKVSEPSTLASRAAARQGKTVKVTTPLKDNSTLASRSAERAKAAKQVSSGDAEDKAVAKASTKKA